MQWGANNLAKKMHLSHDKHDDENRQWIAKVCVDFVKTYKILIEIANI
jgi:hypothetical protein